jgi:hypothetical protein
MKTTILLATFAASLCAATTTQAAYVALISDATGGVIERGDGSFDITDLTYAATFGVYSQINPSDATVISAPYVTNTFVYQGDIESPASFGGGIDTNATSGVGDAAGIGCDCGSGPGVVYLWVPSGYTTGEPLEGASLYAGATLASLGLTRGNYVWSWGSGDHFDTFTLLVGAPETSTWTMMIAGFAGLGFMGWRGSRRTVTRAA